MFQDQKFRHVSQCQDHWLIAKEDSEVIYALIKAYWSICACLNESVVDKNIWIGMCHLSSIIRSKMQKTANIKSKILPQQSHQSHSSKHISLKLNLLFVKGASLVHFAFKRSELLQQFSNSLINFKSYRIFNMQTNSL